MEEKNFSELLEESLRVPDRGKIFKGKVVRVDDEDVFIDFGSKSEGIAPITEFYGKNGGLKVNVGDEVEVILETWNGEDGLPKLSKRRADLFKESDRLEQLFNNGKALTSKIIEKVKGGLIADVGQHVEIRAFLPSSQIDLKPSGDPDQYLGKTVDAKIIKLSTEGIIISRRTYLEEQREIQRKRVLSYIKEGKIFSGKVTKIIDHGVVVDLGGVEGFIPISELSWGRVRHPSDIVSINEEIKVKVLKIDEDERISLGLKQIKPDPWTFVDKKYTPGVRIRGKAISTTDFGVFVELEPGVEGLIHISEITWTKRFRHPKEVVTVGSRIEVVVVEVDVEKRRISLSLRRIDPSPWEILKEKTTPGTRVKGKIKNVNDIGIFVEVEDDLVGLVHISDISWIGKINPRDAFNIGDTIDVSILDVDVKTQRIKLGIKQLSKDPWEYALEMYKPGETILTGKVIDIKDAGIVLEFENGLHGFIRSSELGKEEAKESPKEIRVGDEITAQITGFERVKRQINLSRRRYEQWLEKERVSSFLASQGEGSVKLGDVLGEKLKSLIKE